MYTFLSTGRVEEHLVALDIQGQTVPLAIVDIIVKTHRAPVPHVHQDLAWYELHSELHFPFLRQNWEKKSTVDAMNSKAEDQGDIGGVVGGRDNGA